MKKHIKSVIQRLAPFYFELITEIKRVQKLGYEITEIYMSYKQLDQLVTVNTILADGGLEPIVIWKRKSKQGSNELYYNNIIINRYSKRLGFKIIIEDVQANKPLEED